MGSGLVVAWTLWWGCGRPVDSWFLLAALALQRVVLRACWYLADKGTSFDRWNRGLCDCDGGLCDCFCDYCGCAFAKLCPTQCPYGCPSGCGTEYLDECACGWEVDMDMEPDWRCGCDAPKGLCMPRRLRALRTKLCGLLFDYVRFGVLVANTLTGSFVHHFVGTVGLAIWLELAWKGLGL